MSGGRSSSSNRTSTSSTTVDAKQTADGEAIVIRNEGGDVLVTETADGAFEFGELAIVEALDFAERVSSESAATTRDGFTESARATAQALDALSQGFEQAIIESREDTTQLLQQAMILAAVLGGTYIVFGRG